MSGKNQDSLPDSLDMLKQVLNNNFATEPEFSKATLNIQSDPMASEAKTEENSKTLPSSKKPKKIKQKKLNAFLTPSSTQPIESHPKIEETKNETTKENDNIEEAELSFKDIREVEDEKSPDSTNRFERDDFRFSKNSLGTSNKKITKIPCIFHIFKYG